MPIGVLGLNIYKKKYASVKSRAIQPFVLLLRFKAGALYVYINDGPVGRDKYRSCEIMNKEIRAYKAFVGCLLYTLVHDCLF